MGPFKRVLGAGAAVAVGFAMLGWCSQRPAVDDVHPPALGRQVSARAAAPLGPNLDGLDPLAFQLDDTTVKAPLSGGRIANLTLDPVLQRTALRLMRQYQPHEAAVVLLDVRTGDTLVYASHAADGSDLDYNARSEAPAASLFKLVTSSALLETAGLSPDVRTCYHGGLRQITAAQLSDDARRDRSCASLSSALGRSLNVVFAKRAVRHLDPGGLTQIAQRFGFGNAVPFDLPNEASVVELPEDNLGFARAAAGFWHTFVSPLGAASMLQSIALDGVMLRPRLVAVIQDESGNQEWRASAEPEVLRRTVEPATARGLNEMMRHTVLAGTARGAFLDARGRPYLPGIAVAGKTGSLSREQGNRNYTWFGGFAPADAPEVAVAALVVNTPSWRIKGSHLARDVLRAYFTRKGRPHVSMP